jgi:COP9 signalosome complex subunit 3
MELLQRNQQNLRNLLQIFPLPEFTIAHMAVLQVLTSNVQTMNPDLIINEIHACLVNIDEKQIQYASDILSSLCGTYTNKLCDDSRPKNSALLLLYDLITKLQKTPNQLTSLHSHLLQLSLVSKNFSLALDVMANDVLDINKESQTYESKAFLEYFYFSGCILAAIKNYDKALFFFEQAITLLPCNAISQIMVESYKKFILISLIHKGLFYEAEYNNLFFKFYFSFCSG